MGILRLVLSLSLANAFDSTPQLWLNLQQKYDLWIEENEKVHIDVAPLYKEGMIIPFRESAPTQKRITD